MHKRSYLVSQDDWDVFPIGAVHLFEIKNNLETANQERE